MLVHRKGAPHRRNAREVDARHGLVDHGHPAAGCIVSRRKVAADENGHAHGPQILRPDDVVKDLRVAVGARPPGDHDAVGPPAVEENEEGEGRPLHARNGAHALFHARHHAAQAGIVFIARAHDVEARNEDVLPVEPGVHVHQVHQAVQEESRAGQQRQGQGYLRHDQPARQVAAHRSAHDAAPLFERRGQFQAGGAEGRDGTEHQHGQNGDPEGEGEHGQVGGNAQGQWVGSGIDQGQQQPAAAPRQQYPEGRSAQTQQDAFHQQLVDDASAPGSDRHADGDLALPRRPRASSRLATLAQAISSTTATRAMRIVSGEPNW